MTLAPWAYVPEQVPVCPVEQLIPDGEATEPLPLTLAVNANEGNAKDAPTETFVLPIVTLQVHIPVQPLLHPVNTYPVAGVAAKLIELS